MPELAVLTLARGHVDVYCTWLGQIQEAALLTRYRALLTSVELEQAARFHFERDALRHVVTRAMVRTVLSRYAAVPPQDWRFVANAHGKPAIVNHEAPPGLAFNISHTDGLVVVAVGGVPRLGVDVENFMSRPAPLEVADHCFSAREARELRAQSPAARQRRFFEYWTLKESYIKARGLGLSIPLEAFSFELDCQPIALSFERALHDRAEHWDFRQIQVSPQHLVALCAEREPGVARRIALMRIVPLAGDATALLPDGVELST